MAIVPRVFRLQNQIGIGRLRRGDFVRLHGRDLRPSHRELRILSQCNREQLSAVPFARRPRRRRFRHQRGEPVPQLLIVEPARRKFIGAALGVKRRRMIVDAAGEGSCEEKQCGATPLACGISHFPGSVIHWRFSFLR
jgi:hypothetical protein